MKYDFSGWATRNDLLCSDGRTIRKDAFKDNDGQTVPLVWNHQHNDPLNVLGHALLKNRDDGVYAYCTFNGTPSGQNAKLIVEHGDVCSLSIYANKLRQQGGNVLHGEIKEVSLVLAGANPGALIDSVMAHGDEEGEAAIIYTNEKLFVNRLAHADSDDDEEKKKKADENSEAESESESESKSEDEEKTEESSDKKKDDTDKEDDEETVGDVFNSMTEKQKNVVYALVGQALASAGEEDEKKEEDDDSKGGNTMKHNVFDNDRQEGSNVLSHADQVNIITRAKSNSVGSFQEALNAYMDQNSLQHDFDDIDILFPDYKDVRPGAPEFIERDQGWVTVVMQKIHKSPMSRIRTRQSDITGSDIRAYGYVTKGDEKAVPGNIKLLKRTTDPQTIYRKDALNRDDIIDITDFDVVQYMYQVMRQNLNEEIALAIMIGDGRDEGADYKISEDHVRSIWNDDDVYTIHYDVDYDTFAGELQGTNTSASFGENYIYAEAIVQSALYAREDYKGTGTPDFFCTPHLLNVMLLARDLNGRRIYESKAELEKALNVGAIYTAEQFEGLTRTTSDNLTKELLGIFVNLTDYTVGSTKGGEITKFNQFDIDFNQEKYLIETRISGALTRAYSAVALEKDVTEEEEAEG